MHAMVYSLYVSHSFPAFHWFRRDCVIVIIFVVLGLYDEKIYQISVFVLMWRKPKVQLKDFPSQLLAACFPLFTLLLTCSLTTIANETSRSNESTSVMHTYSSKGTRHILTRRDNKILFCCLLLCFYRFRKSARV